ncbi:MAG: Bax inhibitor-1/YccA family protein [Immundisolibacterales bacterium]|nr:Bax inhibitor-1/YccA family protein [Immundisolibacterales bacterium]
MAIYQPSLSGSATSVVATNRLIRNTYSLLALTLLFSGLTAGLSMVLAVPPIAYLLSVGGAFLLIFFVLPRTARSANGLWTVFAITGLLGFGLGPIISMYLALPNGSNVVMTALGGTGVIFLALSGYALTTRRDFSFLGGFLFTGFVVVLVAAVANIFLQIPILSLVISAVVILIMSGFILFDTSRMVNGGETNYILATVSLYLSIFNIFIHLLHLLGFASGDD